MKNLTFNNGLIKIVLTKDKDKHLYFKYFGTPKYNWILNREDNSFMHFLEIAYEEGNINFHHGFKLVETSYAKEAKYVSHTCSDDEFVVVTKNAHLEVETHFRFYKESMSFSSYHLIKNIAKEAMHLENISSFYLSGFGQKVGHVTDKFEFYQANSTWKAEAQWIHDSFEHLGIFLGNDCFTLNRINLTNVGAWSTKEHLPMAMIENKKRHQCLMGQVENNGSWHIEVGDNRNTLYASFGGPNLYDTSWAHTLKPGEVFESVHATISLGKDFEECIQELTKARRQMRRPSDDNEHLPIIFNDYMHALWDTQTTDLILPLVDIASEAGCDEFCIDAGWFAPGSDWWPIIGEWEEYEPNFPNGGLKAVIDYIHKKGMKAGIWFEIEMVGAKSPLAKSLPDNYFFMINGKKHIEHDRLHLDFSNPDVYKMTMDKVCEAIDKYQLDYIKNDYNTDLGVGTTAYSDNPGEGLLRHSRAFIKWLNELLDKYPHLTFENCGSGGCRMDYEMLKVCPIQSTSDQTDYTKYPYLSANVLTAATPEQAAVWSYPVDAYTKLVPSKEDVAMNMVNAMLGRIHLASYINTLDKEKFDLVKEGLAYYRSINEFKKSSLPIFPNGTSYFFDKDVTGGLINGNRIILAVWNTSGAPRTVKVNLKKYNIKNINVGYPTKLATSFEMKDGYLYVNFATDYGGRVFDITLKN